MLVASDHNQLASPATMSHTATTITIVPRATSALSEQYSKQPGAAGVSAVLTSTAKMARQMTVHKIVNRQRMRNPDLQDPFDRWPSSVGALDRHGKGNARSPVRQPVRSSPSWVAARRELPNSLPIR